MFIPPPALNPLVAYFVDRLPRRVSFEASLMKGIFVSHSTTGECHVMFFLPEVSLLRGFLWGGFQLNESTIYDFSKPSSLMDGSERACRTSSPEKDCQIAMSQRLKTINFYDKNDEK